MCGSGQRSAGVSRVVRKKTPKHMRPALTSSETALLGVRQGLRHGRHLGCTNPCARELSRPTHHLAHEPGHVRTTASRRHRVARPARSRSSPQTRQKKRKKCEHTDVAKEHILPICKPIPQPLDTVVQEKVHPIPMLSSKKKKKNERRSKLFLTH